MVIAGAMKEWLEEKQYFHLHAGCSIKFFSVTPCIFSSPFQPNLMLQSYAMANLSKMLSALIAPYS